MIGLTWKSPFHCLKQCEQRPSAGGQPTDQNNNMEALEIDCHSHNSPQK